MRSSRVELCAGARTTQLTATCDNCSASLVTVRLLRPGSCAGYPVPAVTTAVPRHIGLTEARPAACRVAGPCERPAARRRRPRCVCRQKTGQKHHRITCRTRPFPVRLQEDALGLQLVDEPVILGHWIELLYPRVRDVGDAGEDPRDRVGGVPGLRSAPVPGGVRLYRPGLGRRSSCAGSARAGGSGSPRSARAPAALCCGNRAGHGREGGLRRPDDRAVRETLSALLPRIRATAGAGPANSTDVWTSGRGLRLETTDGPPCPISSGS